MEDEAQREPVATRLTKTSIMTLTCADQFQRNASCDTTIQC